MNSSGVLARKSPGAMKARRRSELAPAPGWRKTRCNDSAAVCSARRSSQRPVSWAMVDRSMSAAGSGGTAIARALNTSASGAKSPPSNASFASRARPIGTDGRSAESSDTWLTLLMRSLRGLARVPCRAQDQHRVDQGIDVALIGSVVDDRSADREPAADRGGRGGGDAGVVQVGDDPGVERVGLAAAVAEAHHL